MAVAEAVTAKEVISKIKDLVDISEKIGILKKIKGVFLRIPPLLANSPKNLKLSMASLRGISQFPSMTTWIRKMRPKLRKLCGTSREERPQCASQRPRAIVSKICNIFDAYLDPWLQRRLIELNINVNSETYQNYTKMTFVFHELRDLDEKMSNTMQSLSSWLQGRAKLTYDFYLAGDLLAANKSITESHLANARNPSVASASNPANGRS
jgi:hypothetical protein